MDSFGQALTEIGRLKSERIVIDYALGGAMALVFWSEPVATFDVDIFVRLPPSSALISLSPVYEWARRNGFSEQAEHIVISGIPVQIIPAHNELAEEAIAAAAELDYEGQPVRVIRPEYLIGLYLETSARSAKRLERVAVLLEQGVDRQLLDSIIERYGLKLPSYE